MASHPYRNIDMITATVGRGDCFVVRQRRTPRNDIEEEGGLETRPTDEDRPFDRLRANGGQL